VPILLLGPPFFPIILFGSTTLLTGMTSISLHHEAASKFAVPWQCLSKRKMFFVMYQTPCSYQTTLESPRPDLSPVHKMEYCVGLAKAINHCRKMAWVSQMTLPVLYPLLRAILLSISCILCIGCFGLK
jgi:hypothetical protein